MKLKNKFLAVALASTALTFIGCGNVNKDSTREPQPRKAEPMMPASEKRALAIDYRQETFYNGTYWEDVFVKGENGAPDKAYIQVKSYYQYYQENAAGCNLYELSFGFFENPEGIVDGRKPARKLVGDLTLSPLRCMEELTISGKYFPDGKERTLIIGFDDTSEHNIKLLDGGLYVREKDDKYTFVSEKQLWEKPRSVKPVANPAPSF